MTLIDAIQLIRGPAGSTAVLVIQRGSQKLTVSVVRAPIRVIPRAELIRPGLAYLRIYSFSDGTGEQARRASRALAAHGSIRGVVLDLRGNGGGSYREIVSVAGVFLPSETVIAQLIQHGQASPIKATGESLFPSVPLVVLSDGKTAAASETLMTGLRSTHRSTIIGEKNAGAWLADVRVPLPAGGMQYTFEEVVGPHSEPIHGVGVTPDSTVPLTEADMERGVDTQLDAALKLFGG